MTTTPKSSRPLTPKQERFVIEYAKDLNATQAAIRAGYTGKYVRNTAVQLLCRTKEILEARKAQVLAKRESTGIASLEQTLKLCTAMAFHDFRRLFNQSGQCIEPPELSRLASLAVAGFKIDDLFEHRTDGEGMEKVGVTRDYKIADRAPYVNMLLKYHGAFPAKKLELTRPPREINPALRNLSVEQRMQLRDKITRLIDATIDEAKVVTANPHTNGHTNGHGAA